MRQLAVECPLHEGLNSFSRPNPVVAGGGLDARKQPNSVVDRVLVDPRRILPERKGLHLGQTVRLMDWRDGQMQLGTVVAMKDTHPTYK